MSGLHGAPLRHLPKDRWSALQWHVERLFAWPTGSRRLLTRNEAEAENYLGLLQRGR